MVSENQEQKKENRLKIDYLILIQTNNFWNFFLKCAKHRKFYYFLHKIYLNYLRTKISFKFINVGVFLTTFNCLVFNNDNIFTFKKSLHKYEINLLILYLKKKKSGNKWY